MDFIPYLVAFLLSQVVIAAVPAYLTSLIWSHYFFAVLGLPAIPFIIFWKIWMLLIIFLGNGGIIRGEEE